MTERLNWTERYDTIFLIYSTVEKSKLQKANTMFFNIHVHRLKKNTWKNMSKCSQWFIDAVVFLFSFSTLFFPKFSVINMCYFYNHRKIWIYRSLYIGTNSFWVFVINLFWQKDTEKNRKNKYFLFVFIYFFLW